MTAIAPQRASAQTARLLLCSGEPTLLIEMLADAGDTAFEIDVAADQATAVKRLAERPFEICLVDVTWDDAAVAELCEGIQNRNGATQLVRLSEGGQEIGWGGPSTIDVVPPDSPPALIGKLLAAAAQKARLQAENRSLKRQLQSRVLNEIGGQSETTVGLRDAVRQAADADGHVLIHGETGAGTQQVARLVHLASRRATRPFIVLDCRVHSAESLERELLGEAAADSYDPTEVGTAGRLATCAGGSLLLKNVELLPVATQKKLAGILSRQSYTCLATGKQRPVDVRVMGATHADLAILVQEGKFPASLYEQLSGCTVHVPALRERSADIGILAENVLNHLAVVEGKPVKRLSVEGLNVLRAHDWPGNLRELENVIERACSLDEGALLTAEMLQPWIAKPVAEQQESSALSLREMERKLIETTFARCQGNREHTARLLKIGIRTLSGKLREYGYPPRGGPGSNRRLTRAA
ncbi:MAG TPA: sigma 54-interacting transcriptional regulator [Planctomycetaceae bacterium]|jgi:DNA-binding NtrC family response regulator|nr:sigma 54-interacting transcriptional regulator [Planctomycetaceae bacterium]